MNVLKRKILESPAGNFILRIRSWYINTFLSDKVLIKKKFRKKMGSKIDLNDPKTLNEKINWLKLYDRTDLHTICADKYAVRAYVKEKIGDSFLIPLYFNTSNIKEINATNITQFPCIIKTNHDSSGGIILRSSQGVNWEDIQEKLSQRMSADYYKQTREWQYKNIERRIVVERLLTNKEGNIPEDIKIHIIDGKPELIQIDMGRGTNDHFRNWYSPDWELLPMSWSSKIDGRLTDPKNVEIPVSQNLELMLEKSLVLAEPFRYVRIDWYDLENLIYFGEITFHHDGGYMPILPKEWDLQLGAKLKL